MTRMRRLSQSWSAWNELVLSALLRIVVALGVVLVLFGAYLLVEPVVNASMYLVGTLLFLTLVIVLGLRLSSHRPRSRQTLSSADIDR